MDEAVIYAIEHGCIGNIVEGPVRRLIKKAGEDHGRIDQDCVTSAFYQGFMLGHKLRAVTIRNAAIEISDYSVELIYDGVRRSFTMG